MNTHYKLRVTLEECEADHVVALIGSVTTQYAYVKEIGHLNERPHMHLYLIVPPTVKPDTLRTKLRKLTGSARGNTLYSLGQLKFNTEEEDIAVEYLAYMFKEGEVVALGFTDAWLEKARAYDLQVKTEMQEKRKKKASRVTDIILQMYLGTWDEETRTIEDPEHPGARLFVTKEYIVKSVVDYYKNHTDVLVRKFMLISTCQTLCLRYVNSYDYFFEQELLKDL